MYLPSDILLPYQKTMRDLANNNRLCFFLCSRQIGKSLTLAYIAVEKAWTNPNSKIVLISSGERAALEILDKVKRIAKIFQNCFSDTVANFTSEILTMEVRISNGSRIITLPSGDPEKVRGYSPLLTVCDEFSTLEHQDAFYRAIFPSITSPFGPPKSLIISGTPIGRSNTFWRLWEEQNDYKKYSLNIYEAKSQGLNVDIDTLKKNMIDEESFAQEFLCQPLDSNVALFSYELLNSVTYTELPKVVARYMGIDIGRTHDKTAITILAECADGKRYVEKVIALSNLEFKQQFEQINTLIKTFKPRKVSIDRTGIGMQLAEDLARVHGALIDGLAFTAQSKLEIFNNLKKAFSQSDCLMPDDTDLIKDLNKIKRVVTQNGISYTADSDDTGHADKATSVALANRAYMLSHQECDFLPFSF